MKNKSTESTQYKFLSNKPLGKDLFENQSQEKTASILADNIDNNSDLKIIGIDGEWGSGKSNLVGLLKNKLDKSHKFLIYDVWGHQEDNQRRAILVRLTEFIKDKSIVNNISTWEKKLRKLLAKSKVTETKSLPKLNFGFILFLLITIMYGPIVISLGEDIKGLNSLKWPIYLSPFIVLALIYLIFLTKNWFSGNNFKRSFALAFQDASQIYTDKQEEETKHETISENEPSVKEFREWIELIDRDLGKSKKKIVVVFDNFDRLPKENILSIWSSIHIFFAEKTYDNIKVILPFDREHLQNAFSHLNNNITAGDVNSNNKPGSYADDYINKTFDVVFRISPPLMSDWKKFFRNQWKEVFKTIDNDELDSVITAFEFLNRKITPREINALINEILTLKLLNGKYKERYIAIFILRKDQIIKNPLKAITTLNYLNGLEYDYKYDDEFSEQITAITYQVQVEHALELIYTTKLRDALQKNYVNEFNEIGKMKFADDVFNTALSGVHNYENAIKTLYKIDSNTKISKVKQESAWNQLYQNIRLKEMVLENELKLEDWQLIILEKAPNNNYLVNLLKSASSLLDSSNIGQYVDIIDDIKERVGEKSVSEFLPEREAPVDGFVNLIELKGSEYEFYNLNCNETELDEYLSKKSIKPLVEIKNSETLVKNFNLPKYFEILKDNLEKVNDVELAKSIFLKLKEFKKEDGSLKEIISDQKISSFYNNRRINDYLNVEFLAIRIAKGNSFNSSYKSLFNKDLQSEELAKDVADTILNYSSFKDLLLLARNFNNSPLYRKTIILLMAKEYVNRDDRRWSLIRKYNDIKSSLTLEGDTLLNELSKWNYNFKDFSFENVDDIFVDDCLNYNELDISKKFITEFNAEFQFKTEEEYYSIFQDENNTFFKYFKHLDKLSITQESLNVFDNLFNKQLQKGLPKQLWWGILDKVQRAQREDLSIAYLLKNIRDKIKEPKINWNSDNIQLVLKTLPYLLMDINVLLSDTEIFRLILKIEFLSNPDYVNLLIENKNNLKKIFDSINKKDKEVFVNTINEKKLENEQINELSEALGIK